jgi:uncharacterized membrane protein YfcA
LASGAVIGAAIGVKLAHIPGAEPVAKRMMGVTLWIVSVRFVWDVVKSLRERAAGSEDQA